MIRCSFNFVIGDQAVKSGRFLGRPFGIERWALGVGRFLS